MSPTSNRLKTTKLMSPLKEVSFEKDTPYRIQVWYISGIFLYTIYLIFIWYM